MDEGQEADAGCKIAWERSLGDQGIVDAHNRRGTVDRQLPQNRIIDIDVEVTPCSAVKVYQRGQVLKRIWAVDPDALPLENRLVDCMQWRRLPLRRGAQLLCSLSERTDP